MIKCFFNKIFSYLAVFGLMFLASVFLAENSSAKIENNVSATAVNGGNTVTNGGTIKTGNATATVNAENYVNGGENVQNKVEARAEVQGEGATASVEVNGEKKSCVAENGEGCEVEINNAGNLGDADNGGDREEKSEEKDKNFIQAAAGAIADFTKNITAEIISWFS